MICVNQAKEGIKKTRAKRKAAQAGEGFGSSLAKAGFELGSRALSSGFSKKLINKGIDNIPNIFKFGAKKIKNKNIQRA